MTASGYVVLAEREVAGFRLSPYWERRPNPLWFNILGHDETVIGEEDPAAIMRAALTPENAASEKTLARALVASRITVDPAVPSGRFYAHLREQFAIRDSEAEARDRLLDALFAQAAPPQSSQAKR